MSVIRVSVIRCEQHNFTELKQLMEESFAVLEPGIRQMRGLLHFYAGEDEEVSSLVNVSFWRTLEDAKQLGTYQPMLDLGAEFVARGAVFERPVMNYGTQWEFAP